MSWLRLAIRLPPGKLQTALAALGLLELALGYTHLTGLTAARTLAVSRAVLLGVVAVAVNGYAALRPHAQVVPLLALGAAAVVSAAGGVQLARRPHLRWVWAILMFAPMLVLRIAMEMGVRQWGAF
jgi:hypothetical protein